MARQWNDLAAAAAAFKASIPGAADLSEIEQDIAGIKDEMAATAEALNPTEPETP